jgi:diguanylate cyclase (GGDEF)-like protein
MAKDTENTSRELTEFQERNIRLMAVLLEHDVFDPRVIEFVRDAELEYFSLVDKIKVLDSKVNIDEKTSLLKYRPDYLTNIIKTVSRIYHGMTAKSFHVAFVRFDIDDFSRFNNRYGHEVGDKVLVEIAQAMKSSSRPTDYVIRFGGEEFDALLPGTRKDGAEVYVRKIFEKLSQLAIPYGNERLKVTVSAGISILDYALPDNRIINDPSVAECFTQLQIEADNALYDAKYQGKNRYCFFCEDKKEEYSKIRKLYVK